MRSKKRKITAGITAVILILALGLAGTFAASSSDSSDGGFGEDVETSLFLHDDFSPGWDGALRDRDVYVENTGDTSLYVRIRLDEFMRYGNKILAGAGGSSTDTSKWKPHIPAGTDVSACDTEIHDYFTIQMGNTAGIKYKPKTKNAYTPAVPESEKTETTPKAKVILIDDYLNAKTKPDPCWVLDNVDGYAYWYTQLKKGTATGLILNSITNTGLIDESYFYGINARAEAVTETDLNAWFHGTAPTDGATASDRASTNAARLLKNLSPKYIEITEDMEKNGAKDYDSDNDGYLTKKENTAYEAEKGMTSTPTPNPETEVEINAVNFPDSALLGEIQKKDTDGDGKLSKDEKAAVTSLDLSGTGIKNYNGLEHFTELTDLNVSNNGLTSVNFLSRTPRLTTLDCSNNQIADLNLGKGTLTKVLEAVTEKGAATQLTNVNCSNNKITALSLSSAPGLTELNCAGNNLTRLDISGNTFLNSITADRQTAAVNVVYDKTDGKYKGGNNLFASDTTFGADDAAYDSTTSGLTLERLAEGKTSTYSAPLSCGGIQKGTLKGTISFTGTIYNSVAETIKATSVNGTAELENKDGSKTTWIVYNKTDSEADLITKDCVTTKPFHASSLYPGWPDSDIRAWLNDGTSGYKSKLSDDMKDAIKPQNLVTASAYNNWGTTQSSTDEIYLLTETGNENELVGKNINSSVTLTAGQVDCNTVSADGSNIEYWWLRSPVYTDTQVRAFRPNEDVFDSGSVDVPGGVRPSLTINLQ